jgi:mono/diheme cytochrome c family protein
VYSIRLEYFEGGGEERLTLQVEGPDIEKTPIANLVTADPSGQIKKELIVSRFRPNADLVEQGRSFFQETGCANCHQLKIENKPLVSELKAKNLVLLRSGEGCLSEKVQRGLPDYALTRNQREAIDAALRDLAKPVDDPMNVHFQMAAKNCYACHSRGELVGPEPARDLLFTTQMQEMGNEGRLPPPLTGVGDKLRPEVIDRILADGSKDRPYMLTRMPGFGAKNLPGLREALVKIDEKNSSNPRQYPEINSEHGKELIAAGRKLAGNTGLSCIKCHRFGDKATPGLEAIDLLKMTERLREDWFRRYLLAPNLYRPGTRMPASFPDGKSVLTSLFDGDPDKQIDSMWAYLSQGKAAKKPTGLDVEAIVLSPDARPVMYRNFIEGLGPRGIGVGYPERVNLAWDAGGMNLALLWKNDFMDAGRHWTGRGAGYQSPLGDFVVPLESSAPVAQLESLATAWPSNTARQRGYQFLGYRLNNLGEPTFRYRFGEVEIEDCIRPYQVNGRSIGFQRELRVKVLKQTEGLVVRFASGRIREGDNRSVQVNEQHRIRIAGCTPEILKIDDHQELRAALPTTGEVTLTEWVEW